LAHAVTPLPRIGVRSGSTTGQFYYTDTSAQFFPEGNNFARLDVTAVRHRTFNETVYNAGAAEAALAKMEDDGYNSVRVFVAGSNKHQNDGHHGVGGPNSRDVPELWPAYLDNLEDFLTRASNHNIYVNITPDEVPRNAWYDAKKYEYPIVNIDLANAKYMARGFVEAKVEYVSQLASEIAAMQNGNLINTVSWDLDNEAHMVTDQLPFSMTSGTVSTYDGGTYNMGNLASRQAAMDNNVNNWFDQSADAIRAHMPDTLITASAFAHDIVGKPGPNGLWPLSYPDARWPISTKKLADNPKVSYVDIHLYQPNSGWDVIDGLNSMEWSTTTKTDKPFLSGEFGANEIFHGNASSAALWLGPKRDEMYAEGFTGSLLWTWDTDEQTLWWNALNNGGAINGVLAPIVRSTPSAPATPTGLVATTAPGSVIDLEWNDIADNERGYLVYRSPDGVYFEEIAKVGREGTSYQDTGLAGGSTYHYRVRAFNPLFFSGSSNIANAPVPIAGDFNLDLKVDGADFLVWQLDPSVGLLSDWEDNYGFVTPPLVAAAAVPEPSSLVLLAVGLMGMGLRKR
jgi:hypothetical protein